MMSIYNKKWKKKMKKKSWKQQQTNFWVCATRAIQFYNFVDIYVEYRHRVVYVTILILNFSRIFDNLKQLSKHASSRDFIDIAWNELYLLQRLFFFIIQNEKFLTSFEIIDTQTQFDIDLKYENQSNFFSFFYTILKIFHWVLFERIKHLSLFFIFLFLTLKINVFKIETIVICKR